MKAHDLKKVFLHSDNGNPMKAGTMLMTLYKRRNQWQWYKYP